jgi:hypothetical protein
MTPLLAPGKDSRTKFAVVPPHVVLGMAVLLTSCSQAQDSSSLSLSAPSQPASGSTRSARPSTEATPMTTAGDSGTAEPDGLQAPDILPPMTPNRLATVVTNDLVVRSLPEISEASTIHPTHLQDGEELFILDGPSYSDGYAWYQVVPLGPEVTNDIAPSEPLPPIGWAASGTPSDVWLLPWTGECPSPEIEDIWRERSLLLLACFGDRQLTLEGARGECSYVVPGYISPAWLNHAWCELMPFDVPSDAFDLGRATLHYHQETGAPIVEEDTRAPVRVVGHFDDPAARTCVEDPPAGVEPTPPELVVLACRSRFVATEVTDIAER